jgi:hypothetical protein
MSRFAVLIQGASGEDQYATLHRRWLDSLATLLRQKFQYDAAHLFVLAEKPGTGELPATAESVRATFAKLASQVKASDQLFVMFIGHGASQGGAKFNLVGPDLSVEDWSGILKPIPGRLAVVDSTSGSSPYLAGLAGPGRVVITATSMPGQTFHTVFAEGFVAAFSAGEADGDKNGRISMLEAFQYAARVTKQSYERAGVLATEVPAFDDTGTGTAHPATAPFGSAGTVAALTYLDSVAIPTAADPAVQQLLLRRQALTDQVDELRRRKPTMPAEEFDKQFEALIIELSAVSRDVRRRTGG